jgi:L,D-transpeptidase catalytic domain/Putative peptidoglycan binding domain
MAAEMKRKMGRHRVALIAIVSMVAALLLLAVGAWAYDNSQKDRIAPGVTIGGVDVGGHDVDEARKIVRTKVVAPLRQPVTVSFDGKRYRLTADELNETADVDGMLDQALAQSREGGLVTRLGRYMSGGEVDTDIPAELSYSRAAVDKFVSDLADEINVEPVDATIIPSGGGDTLSPQPGQDGIELREAQTRNRITQQIEDPVGERTLRARVNRVEPEVTRAELAQQYPTYLTIDRSSFTLRLFKNLKLVKSYTVAVGQAGLETPAGLYHIQDKQVNPWWHVPDSAWAGDLAGADIPPGPDNPLQARWMGIFDGAGIHGTYETSSLGHAFSHGCVRMSIPDVIELYDRVEVGDPIYIL